MMRRNPASSVTIEALAQKEHVQLSADQLDLSAPAVLRKWPSMSGERARDALWPGPYLVADGTLGDCIRGFLAKPGNQRHLYEIHMASQPELITSVLSADNILEIVRLRGVP